VITTDGRGGAPASTFTARPKNASSILGISPTVVIAGDHGVELAA
jgi:hypothetical protein